MMKKKLILIILDGWGFREEKEGNAIKLANPRNFNKLFNSYPSCLLKAHGEAVGLFDHMLGGSEVGHMHIAAGRIVKQDVVRITESIKSGEFTQKIAPYLKNAKRVHILGLASDAGVHSSIYHFYGVMKACKELGIKDVFIHAFLDGRDTLPKEAEKYLKVLEDYCKELGIGEIASICGRYYAMDRDKRWDRTKKAFDMLTKGIGRKAKNWRDAINKAYRFGETDEFVKPTMINEEGKIRNGDVVVFINFRPDRARQLTQMLSKMRISLITMTQYFEDQKIPFLFGEIKVKNSLGEIISKIGKKQIRIAESEKYAHVTYFFNCGREEPFEGEDRVIFPSPKVPTYDLTPKMRAYDIAEKAVEVAGKYDFVLINFANPDMVGHTGNLKATIEAIKHVDKCLKKVVDAYLSLGYLVAITGDHGNAEEMIDVKTGSKKTSHTFNPVPFIILEDKKGIKLKNGGLSNIAPTLLKLIGIEKPKEMGSDLLE